MGRWVLIATAVLLAVAGGAFWLGVLRPEMRYLEFCRETREEFKTLAKKRPPTLTRKQWHHIVAWTLNAHGNCIPFARKMPQAELDRFLAELRGRLEGPVDLVTIDWIWDELVRLTSYGQSYSNNWRPTTPERLQEFERMGFTWGGIEVD